MIDAHREYCNSSANYLDEVYAKPSIIKKMAFNDARKIMDIYNGYKFRIIRYNKYTFSCGFICYINDKMSFVYITKDNTRYITMEEIAEKLAKEGK